MINTLIVKKNHYFKKVIKYKNKNYFSNTKHHKI